MEDFRESLHAKGYAVVPGVLSQSECARVWTAFQEYNEQLTGNELTPQGYDHSKRFHSIHGIVMVPSAISYAPFVDAVRDHPEVQDVWRQVYNTDEESSMVCSSDRVNFMPPVSWMDRTPRRQTASWWHVDQRSSEPGFKCVQGYVDILGSPSPQHGGLRVIEGSHHAFSQLVDSFDETKWRRDDWKRFEEKQLEDVMGDDVLQTRVVDVVAEAGSVVLWDSRTVHMNRNTTHPSDPRFVVYVCFWPEEYLDDNAVSRRALAREHHRATSHWPDARKLFPIRPQWSSHIPRSMDDAAIALNAQQQPFEWDFDMQTPTTPPCEWDDAHMDVVDLVSSDEETTQAVTQYISLVSDEDQ